ncbi:hypothetical protein [Vitiosangium sp. GDMCC 1.1324]|uniref:hypothetical protein n=1 Tax=Vitiosangium sp. (strain GDMCC 1.1324) TaxID=2138576 RepID=UPI000D344285|nr:hypothetical protein [Vitiosangium sp. GDMCC 1.1324]PTL82561.1 hypothetical protein DAT35_17320 [Vitiosangium sp. GDMCC 1.1324]
MRTSWLLLLGCLATACGGNLSNDDLEFFNALPMREDLASKLPGSERSASGGGLRQRSDLLTLGAPSEIYVETRAASDTFNQGMDGLLTVLEEIRKLPPTTRGPDYRVWGPWPDEQHPGHEVRFLMVRDANTFGYQLQFRPKGSGEEGWWSALEGTFQADGGLRKGTGAVRVLVKETKAHGFDMGSLSGMDLLEIVYQTRALPISVRMRFVPASTQAASEILYAYREIPGGLGEMGFVLQDTDLIPGTQKEDLTILSRWTRDSGGVGVISVTGGDVPAGFTWTQIECWDASFRLTYLKQSWETAAIGNASACPDVSALEN